MISNTLFGYRTINLRQKRQCKTCDHCSFSLCVRIVLVVFLALLFYILFFVRSIIPKALSVFYGCSYNMIWSVLIGNYVVHKNDVWIFGAVFCCKQKKFLPLKNHKFCWVDDICYICYFRSLHIVFFCSTVFTCFSVNFLQMSPSSRA